MKKFIYIAIILVIICGIIFCIYAVGGKDDKTEKKTAPSAEEIAAEKVAAMSMEEKVGQMFFVCYPPEEDGAEAAKRYHFGGYVLFADFFESRDKDSVKEKISAFQKASKIPLLIGVDEEGGDVIRVSQYSQYGHEPFESPQQLYAEGGFEAAAEDAAEKSDFLLRMGINVNLAPVCDISTDANDFIYHRTVGLNAKGTSDYVKTVVKAMNKKKMGSALKHFPGYGNNSDTHTGSAHDSRDYETFARQDFKPFSAGIDAGSQCVLVCHNIVDCMDADRPASLSPKVHEILRDELDFNGVIMTDDLSMDAVTNYSPDPDAAVDAVLAGNDLLCTGEYEEQIAAIIDAVKENRIPEKQIDKSVKRILLWKYALGLI